MGGWFLRDHRVGGGARSDAGVFRCTAGHCVATGLAVLTGDLIGEYLSEKVVAYAGGALFISFAVGTLIEIFEKLN